MNDEMAMKWRGGTKSKIVVERMLNVFDLHFPTPAVEAMSRICACKTERNLQMFGWCLPFKQSCPWATLSYFCLQNYYYLKCLLGLKADIFTLFFEAHHSTRTKVWTGMIFTARSFVRYIKNKRRMLSKLDK
jgi:hypothetical protein